MKIECTTSVLDDYSRYLEKFCREETAEFRRLKKKCETVKWNDEVYMSTAEQINECAELIADSLDAIYAGADYIKGLKYRIEQYLQTASLFPK